MAERITIINPAPPAMATISRWIVGMWAPGGKKFFLTKRFRYNIYYYDGHCRE